MEIILMRHGRPAFTGSSKVTSHEMADWIAGYDLSDTGNDIPSESSLAIASSAHRIISSNLPRTLSSLNALGREPECVDEVFREAGLPIFHMPILRLSPTLWAAFFRVMWLLGISRNAEPLEVAKHRAFQAARILVAYAKKSNGPVLLMGHGVMNRLIAKELISLGWKKCQRQGKGYWNAGIYSLR